ncbi:MAG: secondary thiamine-phosphate synthase enzyme YjbQ [Candidatus Omnitrophica bacterium]|nr:secondary thiamine-phosphate synthase enzyme YjbQ [Candidatus Omnitrophota bacterium]MBU4140750.1 secondary thiamine-phosphate synthase enzyme YjbQ [Candidatus Omnitrophota bacterium]
MPVVTKKIKLSSKGETDIIDITDKVSDCVEGSKVKDGAVTIFVSGSTAGLTTIEYEPGLLKDLPKAFEVIAPRQGEYHHNLRWHDGNGFSHVRAAMLGPSLSVPFSNKRLHLGTWQQIVLIDFDNRARSREIIVQIMGE